MIPNTFVDNYLSWLKENIKTKPIKNGYHFTLPFLDNHNDHIEIYAILMGDDVLLSDGGYIISDLEMSGVTFDSPSRKNILEQTLMNYGVKLDEKDNSIYIKTNIQDLPKKKHSLVQCILAVSDLYVLAREHIQNYFFDDVLNEFKERELSVTQKLTIYGKSGYPNNIDILVPTKIGDILIKTVRKPAKDRISSVLFSFMDIKESGREVKDNLIIYDDREFELKKDDEQAANQYNTKFLAFNAIKN